MTYRLRKTALILILICAAVMMLAGTAIAAQSVLLGDADGDGEVTPADASSIQRELSGLRMNGEISEEAADVDGNGVIEITDATYIQRWIAQIDQPYPIGEQPEETTGVSPTAAPTQRPTDEDGWGRDIFRP